MKPDLAFEKWIPAPISPQGEYKSIANYNKECYLFEGDYKRFLFDWWDEELLPGLGSGAFQRLDSLEEAESRIPSDSRKASPGLLGTLAGIRTKTDALEDPTYRPYLKRVFDEPMPVYVYNICLKNELRPEAKALEHKIRTFCIANLEHMIVSLKFFANFSDALVRLCGKRFACIGFTQYHGEWHRHINLYTRHHCWAKDASKFDYKQFSQFMLWFFEWFGRHAGCLDDYQYKLFVHMTVNKVIVSMQGFAFVAVGSNPSGHYLTAIMNTFFNNALNVYAFWKHCGSGKTMKESEIRAFYRRIIVERDLGDDSLEGVLYEYKHFYNEKHQLAVLTRIMDYTMSSVPGPVLDQDFLSLKTTVDPKYARYVPYPFSTRWWSSLDYTFKTLSPADKLAKLCSMRLHAYYNRTAFTTITAVTKLFMEKYRERIGDPEWDAATRQFLSERQIEDIYMSYE